MELITGMRASRQGQVGGAGVSEVSAAFERLGWGVAENARHDLGTDLFVLARDERLFDLGLVVGVQVKAGESYFGEPVRNLDGGLDGWWFRDDDRSHIDAWVSHGSPHLIVLHDLNTRTSYWRHVTADVVTSTGKGAKVFVPIANTVDAGHREALLSVAATALPKQEWEGSAWTGAASLLPRNMLRHALVVPRLLAPHPNAGRGMALTPEQAVALLVQGRVRDLAEFAAAHADVPSLTEAMESPRWSWRFVGALAHRLTTGEIDELLSLRDEAPAPAERAASTVTGAAALLEVGRTDEAILLLEAALACDEAEPVDHAWLTVQHARACAEVGRMPEARAEAAKVQAIRVTSPGDVTATAIAGVAAVLLFNTSAWGQRDVADVITGMDTAAAWWRTQTMSSGLAALTRRTFEAWSRNTAGIIARGGDEGVNDRLFAASQTANYLGDQSAWCQLSGLLGQDMLLRLGRNADRIELRHGLNTLRLAGDEDVLKLAVRQLVANGPTIAVTLAAADVRLDESTRTTALSDLTLLQYGGDVLDEVTANRSVMWLLATLNDPSAFVARTSPSYLLDARLVETLAAVVPAASSISRRAVVDYLAVLPGQEDQFLASRWSRVVRAMPGDTWDEEAALSLVQAADAHHEDLHLSLLEVVARYDAQARARLVEKANCGSLDALAALGDVRTLSTGVVTNLINKLTTRVDQQVRDAQAGSYRLGGCDVGRNLALLNTWHPGVASWDPLFSLLEEESVAGGHKVGALLLLASVTEHLHGDVRSRLKTIALAIAGQPPSVHLVSLVDERDATGAATELAVALGALDEDTIAHQLVAFLAQDLAHRKWAARLACRLNRPETIGVLVALSQDLEPAVRAAAAGGLAFLVAAECGSAIAVNSLQRCLRDPGTAVPRSVVTTLAKTSTRSLVAYEALTRLCGHASAYVRATAASAVTPGKRVADRSTSGL
ncbi:MAG: DUF4365 domain-containing protein [Pseudonocardiaceae bacterium]